MNLDGRIGSSNSPEHKLYGHPASLMISSTKRGPAVHSSLDTWARCIRELLQRNNIEKRRYGHVVSEILGMQYMAGYRRVCGKHPWRTDEIEKVASHFGETVVQVLEPLLAHAAEPAVLLMDSLKIKCSAILGETVNPPFEQPFVAIGGLETWLIVPSSDVTREAREVREIIMHLSTTPSEPKST